VVAIVSLGIKARKKHDEKALEAVSPPSLDTPELRWNSNETFEFPVDSKLLLLTTRIGGHGSSASHSCFRLTSPRGGHFQVRGHVSHTNPSVLIN